MKIPSVGGTRVSFGVRDGQAFLTVNEKVVTVAEVLSSDLEQFKVQLPNYAFPCQISLLAANCELVLSRVILSRDIHYESHTFKVCNGCFGSPIILKHDEYYVLGDNTVNSRDSRYWNEVYPSRATALQPGAVPRDLIHGTLRAIAWPPHRWRFFPPR